MWNSRVSSFVILNIFNYLKITLFSKYTFEKTKIRQRFFKFLVATKRTSKKSSFLTLFFGLTYLLLLFWLSRWHFYVSKKGKSKGEQWAKTIIAGSLIQNASLWGPNGTGSFSISGWFRGERILFHAVSLLDSDRVLSIFKSFISISRSIMWKESDIRRGIWK